MAFVAIGQEGRAANFAALGIEAAVDLEVKMLEVKMKTITYDKTSRDYRAELDGELIGYFRTSEEARAELDRLALEQLRRGN